MERRSRAEFRLDGDVASASLDHTLDSCKAQSRILTLGLGRKEGLERILENFGTHANARILNDEQNIPTWGMS